MYRRIAPELLTGPLSDGAGIIRTMEIPLEPGSAAEWYFAIQGQRQGPIDEATLSRLIDAGQIRAETLVWTPGMPEWSAAGGVPRWASVLHEAAAAGVGSAPPVMPGPIVIPGPQFVPTGYAGFWLRFLAWFIDAIVLYVATTVLKFVVGMPIAILASTSSQPGAESALGLVLGLIIWLLQLAVAWLYFALMESSRHQATLGKMALGIRVTTLNGERANFARVTGRYFAKILSTLILLVGYFMAGFTDRKQALHDMIAGTLVVRGRT